MAVIRHNDVRTAGRHNLPVCDVLVGGFPCQGLSVAGKRAGLQDERSGLFFEFVRIASEFRPTWLVLENVPGLLSSNEGRDFAVVLFSLENAGYSCAWRVLDSQWFGVAQRRRRVFIVCHSDARCAGAVLFEPEGGAGHPATVRKAGTDIADRPAACLNSAGNDGGFRTEPGEHLVTFNWQAGGTQDFTGCADKPGGLHAGQTPAVAYALNAHGGPHGRIDGESETFVTHALTHEGFDASEDGTGRGTPIVANLHENQRGELTLSDTTGALGAGGGKPGQGYKAVACPPPDAHRVREVAGLPRGMDGRRYKQLGNAVTVPVIEWIGWRMIEVDRASNGR
jgi:DNA (cytosine-5)-methyltransferase 1